MKHLYVHVPFCRRRCVYCDFSIAVRRQIPSERYMTAVVRELEQRLARGGWEIESLDTIYLGGGTPSLLSPDTLGRLLAEVGRRVSVSPNAEVTLEANPDDVSAAAVEAWAAAGINRVSLGVQSFDDAVLRWMHRTHDAAAIDRAVRTFRTAGGFAISLDLIFGLPDDLPDTFAKDLERALELAPEHVSVYGLTVEPRTPFGRWVAREESAPAPEARFEREFLLAHTMLTGAGFEHYEVSSYARPGQRSLHNSCYWSRRSYAGLGPAAHSFLPPTRRWNMAHWAAYECTIEGGGDPREGSEYIDRTRDRLERLYLGLRTVEGVPLEDVDREMHAEVLEAGDLQGWLAMDAGRLRLTPAGWLRLDQLAGVLTTLANGG